MSGGGADYFLGYCLTPQVGAIVLGLVSVILLSYLGIMMSWGLAFGLPWTLAYFYFIWICPSHQLTMGIRSVFQLLIVNFCWHCVQFPFEFSQKLNFHLNSRLHSQVKCPPVLLSTSDPDGLGN